MSSNAGRIKHRDSGLGPPFPAILEFGAFNTWYRRISMLGAISEDLVASQYFLLWHPIGMQGTKKWLSHKRLARQPKASHTSRKKHDFFMSLLITSIHIFAMGW